jgi:hypothetical protein
MLKNIKVLINIIYFVQIQNTFESSYRFDLANVFYFYLIFGYYYFNMK